MLIQLQKMMGNKFSHQNEKRERSGNEITQKWTEKSNIIGF